MEPRQRNDQIIAVEAVVRGYTAPSGCPSRAGADDDRRLLEELLANVDLT
jgi:hypothetical protein